MEISISMGKVILFLIVLYFVVKYAVKSGIREYYKEKNESTKDEVEVSLITDKSDTDVTNKEDKSDNDAPNKEDL